MSHPKWQRNIHTKFCKHWFLKPPDANHHPQDSHREVNPFLGQAPTRGCVSVVLTSPPNAGHNGCESWRREVYYMIVMSCDDKCKCPELEIVCRVVIHRGKYIIVRAYWEKTIFTVESVITQGFKYYYYHYIFCDQVSVSFVHV